ncbi:MAG: citramalate synthase [Brevinematales bacterium]|nr:citramalate synthase [Brevinematales bacterium]
MEDKVIYIYDTTMRDGRQGESVDFSVMDMLTLTKVLDDFGVDYIEGGWPASNPKDRTFFEEVRKLELKNAKICAFGSTRHAKNSVKEDTNVRELINSQTPVVTIFGKSWDLHVYKVFNISLEQNLEMIYDTIAYLKDSGKEVIYDAEHFFDGFKDNPDYALKTLMMAEKAGADNISLADTNGGTLPSEIREIIKSVREVIKTPLGIHAHNDSELGVANSLQAVESGVVLVQGTINGFGERCGNANLISIIPSLILKMGKKLNKVDKEKLKKLRDISMFVYDLVNLPPNERQPFVGASAFAHKGGVHVNAVQKDPRTYEHIDPELVGNVRRILISEQAGRSNVLTKIKNIEDLKHIADDDGMLKLVLEKVKNLESQGYSFESSEASFELLVRDTIGSRVEFFECVSFTVNVLKNGDNFINDALVKIRVKDNLEITADEGDGPVNALDRALRKGLVKFYPNINNLMLIDYKVRIINPKEGSAAKIRVLTEFKYDNTTFTTIGVSENIIDASFQAITDAFRYFLLKHSS